MGIKKHIKKIGRSFFDLKEDKRGIGAQSVLVVDNGYSWLGQVCAGIEQVRGYFPRAEVSVLTFPERKSNIEKDFPELNFILRKYQIALQMLLMRKKYDFIALYSLDVTPMIVSLLFNRCKVALYNQWGQWWTLRLRNISEIFKITYVKKKANLIERIGLFFVLVQREDDKVFRPSIAIINSSHTLPERIDCTIQRTRESFPLAEISVLNMIKLKRIKYDYTVVLSLDIFPVIISVFFVKGKIYLFNKWQQWWSIKHRSIWDYIIAVPHTIFNIGIFLYLFFNVIWIFMKATSNFICRGTVKNIPVRV